MAASLDGRGESPVRPSGKYTISGLAVLLGGVAWRLAARGARGLQPASRFDRESGAGHLNQVLGSQTGATTMKLTTQVTTGSAAPWTTGVGSGDWRLRCATAPFPLP